MQMDNVTLGIPLDDLDVGNGVYNIDNQKTMAFEKQKNTLKEILDLAISDTEEDDNIQKVYTLIQEFSNENGRFLYSIISSYINGLNSEQESRLLFFVEELLMYSEKKEVSNCNQIDCTKKYVVKFWDHVNLVITQQGLYYDNNEKVASGKKAIESIFEKSKDDFESLNLISKQMEKKYKKMQGKVKNITTQLISLVSIFTALSFVMFGGIASFQSVFSNIENIPLLKLLVISSIWAIGMVNIIFVFIYYIAKIAKSKIKTEKNGSSVYKRYPMILIVNGVLLILFVFSVWLYAFQEFYGFNNLFSSLSICAYGIIGVVVISVIIAFLFYLCRENGLS
ncbi:MAG: hypothetical protein ACRCSG_02850 [Cellulosilyticaceae bacterium]